MGNFQWQVLSVVENYKQWVIGLKVSKWIDKGICKKGYKNTL